MSRTFIKNLLRDIKKTLSRFLSIVIIITVGVAIYDGVRATSPDLKMSGDHYFKESNFMDFKVISTLGLTEDDLWEIRKLDGITAAEGSYSLDAVVEKDKKAMVVNVNSLPDERGINRLKIVRGRRPEKNDEAVVEERFFAEYGFMLGDTIVLESGDEKAEIDGLKNNEYKIVGTADSPLYISAQRQHSSVGNGSVRGFIYIMPEAFDMDVYTEIYVRIQGEESDRSLVSREHYMKAAEGIKKALEALGPIRNEIRYAEVLKAATDKIEEAEQELKKSRKEAEDKFAEGYRELEAAKAELEKGKDELKRNEILFNEEMEKGEKRIKDGENAISAAEKEIALRTGEIEKGKQEIAEAKKLLEENEDKLNLEKWQAAENISAAISEKVQEAETLLALEPENPEYISQYHYLKNIYENGIKDKDFDSIYASLKKSGAMDLLKPYLDMEALKLSFDEASAQVKAGRDQLSIQEKMLKDGEAELEAGKTELENNRKSIAEAKAQLDKAREEGLARIEDGRKELEKAEKEINENTAKLKAEEEKANNEFRKAESDIKENREKLKSIKKPKWYVLERSDNIGYESYFQDSERIDNIGKVFPLIFFLVAALVSLTTMTRMVQENRREIGIFNALGYSKAAIVGHYMIYSLSASLTGSVIGTVIGFNLFPSILMNAYGLLYVVPDRIMAFDWSLALQAALIAILFITAASIGATLEELRETPASLLRPKAPKPGKKIWLERITPLWKRIGFTGKVTARNIFRYKQRLFMTVTGIAACTGLMVTGFGLREGIVGAIEKQFNDIFRYDMQVVLTKEIKNDEINKLKDAVMEDSNIRAVLFTSYGSTSVSTAGSGNEDVYVVIPEEKAALNDYISLSMKGEDLVLDDEGAILTRKLATVLDKKVGDTFKLTLNEKTVEVKVSAITEHYLQHYIYMSRDYYERITGNKVLYNSFYGLIYDSGEEAENATLSSLKSIDGIGAVSFKGNVHIEAGKSMESIDSVVFILIISAGILAFVVIYNLTNININERRRELATIKLLGFYDKELAMYIYRENIILTIIGCLLGIPLGKLLTNFVIVTAETNIMMFMRTIDAVYFLYSIALTIAFSVIVNLVMYGKFDKIDMIESLKSAE